jgi:prolyl-tRNA editing enzyme YbaK/EbsC (Cys-tRNA(Pro) deacylase)
MLDIELIAKALGAEKVHMTSALDVEQSTRYVLGRVSLLEQKRKLRKIVDSPVIEYPTIFIGTDRRNMPMGLPTIISSSTPKLPVVPRPAVVVN